MKQAEDFESEADKVIDKFFADKGVKKDTIDLWEKRFIVKELALANRKSEIIPKLNSMRKELGLPELSRDFDIFYYLREYAGLIEDISMHYAANLAKKYRFANRITRIGKLNDVAESVHDRILVRQDKPLKDKEERLHNENIKLFAMLLNTIDENMGKLKLTKIDVNVRSGDERPQLENPEVMKKLITDMLKKHVGQLPDAVDANFSKVTEYEKCDWGEEWTNTTFCQFYGEKCKVRSGEIDMCPLFLNKVLLQNSDYLVRRYVNDKLSVRQIIELLGCKENNERVVERVRGKLKQLGVYPRPGDSSELSSVPAEQVEDIKR